MEKLKDIKLLSCLAVLLVFTIGYFLMVNKISYAFWKVSYHNIDFSSLTEVSKWKKYYF